MPAVITQEVPTLPPSIAVVPSAVPVFIGYTEKAEKNGEDITLKATRIRNMREYETWFGTAPDQTIEVDVDDRSDLDEGIVARVISVGDFNFRMHYALQLYYANGGGPCFIISVGPTKTDANPPAPTTPDDGDFLLGIQAASRAKDITILVLPDAVALQAVDYGTVITKALEHCEKMINRVTVIDVADTYGEDIGLIDANFRFSMPTNINHKKYGAAYYPFLATTLNFKHSDTSASVRFHLKNGAATADAAAAKTAFDALATAKKLLKDAAIEKQCATDVHTAINDLLTADANTPKADLKKAAKKATKKVKGKDDLHPDLDAKFDDNTADGQDVLAQALTLKTTAEGNFTTKNGDVTTKETAYDAAKTALGNINRGADFANDVSFATIGELFEANNLIYAKMKEAINGYPVIMPPSPAVAGLYVATDFSQGPWRAPANFSLAGVIRPTVEIDDDLHAMLNVDSNAGKSINAIRSYIGKGVLVFGARTLAGNDLEWRYVNVRRTFCFIEDSVARAMQDFVFAPNIRDTWIKVKAMISNFLNGIWQAGGLFGNTPDEAYQVSVGLPETMTDVDILEGRMIVEIKLRVSRPAEFIILRYEHKFQVTNN